MKKRYVSLLVSIIAILLLATLVSAAPRSAQLDYSKFPTDPGTSYDSLITGHKYYVATSGSDNNAGTLTAPFKTINKAVSTAVSGDGIFVRSGTYNLASYDDRVVISKNNLVLTNYGGEKVTLKSIGSRYGFELTGNNLVVDGFNLDGFAAAVTFGKRTMQKNLIIKNINIQNSGEGFAGSYDGSDTTVILKSALFKNIKISKPQTSGYIIGLHCGGPPCEDVKIENADIDLTGSEYSGSGADAIAMERGNNILVENSVVKGASADGIDLKASNVAVVNTIVKNIGRNGIKYWRGGDIINSVVTDTGADASIVFSAGSGRIYRIINSVVAFHNKNGQTSYTASFGYDDSGVGAKLEIINSIFHKNVGSLWINSDIDLTIKNTVFSGGTVTGRYVDYRGESYGDYYAKEGWGKQLTDLDNSLKEVSDVGFVDAANNNFQLKTNSSAIDFGIVSSATTDILGISRPQGSAFDVGAYELKSTVACDNVCTLGTKQCSGNGYATCTQDTNSCLIWSQVTACTSNQECKSGACVALPPTCNNECTLGTSICSGNGYKTCQTNENSCLVFSSVTSCTSNQECKLGACVALPPQPPVNNTDPNLVLHLSFDKTGNEVYNGGTFVDSGKKGKAYLFDGVDDHIVVADADKLDFGKSDSFTISTWLKTDNGKSGSIVSKKGNGKTYQMDKSGKFPRVGYSDAYLLTSYKSRAVKLNDNSWHHFVSVYDRSNGISVYVDGKLLKTLSVADHEGFENKGSVFIGSVLGTRNFFKGQLDEVKIYNKALSATEVITEFNLV